MKPMTSTMLQSTLQIADSHRSLQSRLAQLWQGARSSLVRSSELQVWQSYDASGDSRWNAYDPQTGATVEHLTEAEMRVWIERGQRFV